MIKILKPTRVAGVWLALVIVASGCEGKATIAYESPAASAASASWTFDGDATGGVPAGAEVFITPSHRPATLRPGGRRTW